MSQCKFEKAAHLYPLGKLTQGEMQAFEAHVTGCGECARIVREAAAVSKTYKSMSVEPPLPGFELRILYSIKKRTEREENRGRFDWMLVLGFNRAMLPVAICLTVCLFVAVLFTNPSGSAKNAVSSSGTTSTTEKQSALSPSGYYIKNSFGENEGKLIADDESAAKSSYYTILSEKYKSGTKTAR